MRYARNMPLPVCKQSGSSQLAHKAPNISRGKFLQLRVDGKPASLNLAVENSFRSHVVLGWWPRAAQDLETAGQGQWGTEKGHYCAKHPSPRSQLHTYILLWIFTL